MADDSTSFFGIVDTTAGCGYDFENESKPFPITRGYIERVDFRNAADGTLQGLFVVGHHGERTVTAAQSKACLGPHPGVDFNPPTKPYRVDFKFDGKRVVRERASAGAPK